MSVVRKYQLGSNPTRQCSEYYYHNPICTGFHKSNHGVKAVCTCSYHKGNEDGKRDRTSGKGASPAVD